MNIASTSNGCGTPEEYNRTATEASTGQAAEAGNTKWHWRETLSDGTRVLIRPIHKKDAALERAFIERLSPESRSYRFLGQVKTDGELIRKMTEMDFSHDIGFVALRQDAGEKLEIGVSRYYVGSDGQTCECAVTVSDEWQGKGLGHVLMRHLIEVARERGIKRMVSIDATENQKMRDLALSLGFERRLNPQYMSEVTHTLVL